MNQCHFQWNPGLEICLHTNTHTHTHCTHTHFLEALPVHNGWTRLIVLLLGDPHLLEGGEGSQDGTTDPDTVLALWWSNYLDLHGGWGQGRDLLHPVSDAREHPATSRQDGVSIQVLPDVHVTLHDGVVGGLMDTSRLHTKE